MKYPDDFINKVICGDCLEILKEIPDESIDMVMTSPPYYALRNYQVEGQIGLEETFEEYLKKILDITAEIKRVLKKSGQFWLNLGDCYGSHTFGNSKSAGGIQKKLCQEKKGFPRYSNKSQSLGDKCLGMIPERLAIKMIDNQGWILRNKIIWAKQILIRNKKKGDYTIGSCMPTSTKDRFNMTWEYLFHFTKSKKYYSDLDAVRIPAQVVGVTDLRPAGILRQRMYPESKYNKFNYRVRDAERKAGQPQYQGKFSGMGEEEVEMFGGARARNKRKRNLDQSKSENKKKEGFSMNEYYKQNPEKAKYDIYPLGKNIPTVWQINPEPHNFRKELGVDIEHFATYPEALCDIPIKFATPPNGIVLDPFMGSGTTLVVAKKLGFKAIGIDLNEGYCEIAKRRLEKIQKS